MYVILGVITSNEKINVDGFKWYCFKAAKLYVQLYSWYHMPPSVHVIFIHGYQIVNKFELPIRFYFEEAQESCNKAIKNLDKTLVAKHQGINLISILISGLRIFMQNKNF